MKHLTSSFVETDVITLYKCYTQYTENSLYVFIATGYFLLFF